MYLSAIPITTAASNQRKTGTRLSVIPSGRAGVRATLEAMRQQVKEGKRDMSVRQTAGDLTQHIQQKNYLGEVKALHRFVRDNIRYTRDISGIETIQGPAYTLEHGFGDCDDKSSLLASLLESIGHKTRFVAVGKSPDNFNHVYVETRVGKDWFPLETTEPVAAGWSPPGMRARMVVHN